MKIFEEKRPRDVEYWSGGKDRACELTDDDWDIIEPILEDAFQGECSETQLNDLFCFDFDMVAEWLGYMDEEDFCKRRSPDYVDPEERRANIIEAVQEKYPDMEDYEIEDKLDEFWDEDIKDENAVIEVIRLIEEPIRRRAAIVKNFISKFPYSMDDSDEAYMNEYIDDNWDEDYPNDDMFVNELLTYMKELKEEGDEWHGEKE